MLVALLVLTLPAASPSPPAFPSPHVPDGSVCIETCQYASDGDCDECVASLHHLPSHDLRGYYMAQPRHPHILL
jgi:hypothetical protein